MRLSDQWPQWPSTYPKRSSGETRNFGSQRFDTRALALQWADEERKHLEKGGACRNCANAAASLPSSGAGPNPRRGFHRQGRASARAQNCAGVDAFRLRITRLKWGRVLPPMLRKSFVSGLLTCSVPVLGTVSDVRSNPANSHRRGPSDCSDDVSVNRSRRGFSHWASRH